MSTCSETLKIQAPAKLNLGLSITGRRPDGFHELASLFWPLDVYDGIDLTEISKTQQKEPVSTGLHGLRSILKEYNPTPEEEPTVVKLAADWAEDAPVTSDLPRGNENLVIRAVRFSGLSANIKLSKRIPIGGGLGGGSSDAGSTLRALVQSKWITTTRAHQLAQELGADVSFFLNPQPSWVTGVGEERRILSIAPDLIETLHFLLVLIPTPCSTAEVFRRYKNDTQHYSQPIEVPESYLDEKMFRIYLHTASNDLTPYAQSLCPDIGTVLDALRQTSCWYADMSGSGSTCFGIYPSLAQAKEAAQVIHEKCRSISCKSLVAKTYPF